MGIFEIMRIFAGFFILFSCCSSTALVASKDDFTLHYGRKVPTKAYPAVGMVLSKEGMCTATLIAQDMILTAAHCVEDDDALQMFIAGDGDSSFVYRKIAYDSKNEFTDIGFALLLHPLSTKPMMIAEEFPEKNIGAVFVGYGCTSIEYVFDKSTGKRHKKTVGGYEKHAIYGRFSEFLPIVHASNSLFVCNGDSGGPVVNARTGRIVLTASTLYAGMWKGELVRVQSGFTPAYLYHSFIPLARTLMFVDVGLSGKNN